MDHSTPKNSQPLLSRREALKALAASTGAAALATIPEQWQAPEIQVGALPAFAQASPLSYPFANEVEVRVERNGSVLSEVTWFEDQGWVGLYVPAGSNRPVEGQEAGGKKPWRRLRRRKVGPPLWAAGSVVVIITLIFKPILPNEQKKKPKGKLTCFGYGRFQNTGFAGEIEDEIENGRVTIAFPLPVGFFGFFFFSCFFPPIISLEDDNELDGTFYFGPCIYGPNAPWADDDDEDDLDDDIEESDSVTLSDFEITFKGLTDNGNGTSTWQYTVEDLNPGTVPDLAKWVLALPVGECATIENSSPGGSQVAPDSESGLIGIQWDTGPGFTSQDFSVTLSGEVAVGLVDVAVKGDDNIVRIGQISGPVCQDPKDEVLLENCYRIVFQGATDNNDGTSTWRYFVEELPCAQDLSNWVLALPFTCTNVIGASPEPWEVVDPDPNANLTGIKWQTGAGFSQGVFEVTLQGSLDVELSVGLVDVAAKGPDVAFGQINGPVCL